MYYEIRLHCRQAIKDLGRGTQTKHTAGNAEFTIHNLLFTIYNCVGHSSFSKPERTA